MNASRSPVDRLRAIRAGRVSQLLDQTPSDALPPTQPAKVTLNGKKVEMGAAFNLDMARLHTQQLERSLVARFEKPASKAPKYREQKPIAPQSSLISPAELAAHTVVSIFQSRETIGAAKAFRPIIGGIADEVTLLKNLAYLRRHGIDPWAVAQPEPEEEPENDNNRNLRYRHVRRIIENAFPPPPPSPGIEVSLPPLSGPDPDDQELKEIGQIPPTPANSPKLPDNTPPDDPEEFNRPQIETIPMEPISWKDLVNYANSHPNTKEDDEDVLQALKKAMEANGIQVVSVADIGIREKEFYLPNVIENVRQRLGSRFADIAIPFEGPDGTIYIGIINTVDVLVDHETPDARERRAAESINSLRQFIAHPVSEIALIPKSRDMDRQEWRDQLDIRAQEIVDRWLEWAAGH